MKTRTLIRNQMRSVKRHLGLMLLGLCSLGVGSAQDKPVAPAAANASSVGTTVSGTGRVLEFQASDSIQAGESAVPGAVRPTRGEQQPVSAEIRAQLLKFESARDAYLKRQKELMQQLKGASDEQRKVVRDQLKGLREQWLEQSLQFRREARGRIADLKTELPQFEALKNSKPSLDNKPDRRLK